MLYLLFASQVALSALFHSSGLDWKTHESKHFSVHFYPEEEDIAKKVTAIAEDRYQILTRYFSWIPETKTDIVISDEVDFANGSASPIPRNTINLYVSKPNHAYQFSYHDWMTLLITHELTHIIHLDMARRAPHFLRKVLGRFILLFPNALQPSWFVEGLATYQETSQQHQFGRGQSAYFNMLMRIEVKNGIKSLSQLNIPFDQWPGRQSIYLYGYFFYEFIEQKYGEKKLKHFINHYSQYLIPFRINNNSKKVLGKNLKVIWKEFENYLSNKFQPQLDSIAIKHNNGQKLSHSGYYSGNSVALTDGTLYYIENDGFTQARIMKRLPNQAKAEFVTTLLKGQLSDIHADNGLLISQQERCDNTYIYKDLYVLPPNSTKLKQLTHCGRYVFASWSPDGKQIIAVHHHLGQNQLHLLSSDGKLVETLWQGKNDTSVLQPDWSPDGQNIVASVWRKNSRWNLEEFSLINRQWSQLTHDQVTKSHPHYSNNNQTILFSAAYNGIPNLYQFNKQSSQITQISNVIGGAFQPIQANLKMPIYYTGYDQTGFNLYQLDKPINTPVTTSQQIIPQGDQFRSSRGVAQLSFNNKGKTPVYQINSPFKTSSYSAYSELIPSYWLPAAISSESMIAIGAQTSGNDPLKRHSYQLLTLFESYSKEIMGSIDYFYDRFWPSLHLNYYRDIDNFLSSDNDKDSLIVSRATDDFLAELIFPFLTEQRRLTFNLAIAQNRASDVFRKTANIGIKTKNDQLLGAALIYKSTQSYPLSSFLKDGRHLTLMAENSDILNSDFTGDTYTFIWDEYVGISQDQLLKVHFATGWGTDSPNPFILGGTFLLNPTSHFSAPFNERNYPIRGYRQGLSALQGRRMMQASLQYHFPLATINRTIMAPPIGINKITANIFIDSGGVWQTGGSPDKFFTGVGTEINIESTLFYLLPITIRIGVAHGLDSLGEDQWYIRLGHLL
ncbi:MAG: hypothetical protein HN826_01355 [Methylococcales bacterium]|nr:hypothetical protein [Methylococcales bacterium]